MAKLNVSRGYVDTGREMPPIHRSECKTIAVDKNLAEQLLSQIDIKPKECLIARDIKITGRARRYITPVMMTVLG